jgi:lysophospholipase
MRANKAMLCLLLLASAMLAACGGHSREPFADSRVPGSLAPRFYPPEGWAWGFLQIGRNPAQRYGVSSPAVTPSAQILILPGYGETAEGWFETVRALNDAGYTTWVLERQGQGGSGRLGWSRDVGDARSFDPDVAAAKAMLSMISSSGTDAPVILLAQGAGAPVAKLALMRGGQADGLILSAPTLTLDGSTAGAAGQGRILRRIGLGSLRVIGTSGWQRDRLAFPSAGLDPVRSASQAAWQTSNPDLRMGGPSYGWDAALLDAVEAAKADPAWRGPPTVQIPTRAAAGQLAPDPDLQAWMAAIGDFVRQRIADRQAAQRGATAHRL